MASGLGQRLLGLLRGLHDNRWGIALVMRLSLSLTNQDLDDNPGHLSARIAHVALATESAGLDTFWVPDHLIQTDPTTQDTSMFEAYSTLSFVAGQTSRIRLGALVTPVTYRPATVLIKTVTTLDVLSGGRAWLGLGAGYHSGEASAMDLPLPDVAVRFEMLEELVALAKHAWRGDSSPFDGDHYRPRRPVMDPRPAAQPHPPILIGGMGEKKTLRLVAEHGDACNLFDVPDGPEVIRHKLAVLREHCAAVGRELGDIDKTISMRLGDDESGEAYAERCLTYRDIGIDHVVAITPGPWTDERLDQLATSTRLISGSRSETARS